MDAPERVSRSRCFGGSVSVWSVRSETTGTPMRFSAFLPEGDGPFPAVVWLSGLTCTEDNFTVKAGAYRRASELGLAVVAPDTSPRGPGVADDDAYDLGQGASFYVDATEAPWAPHFKMETFIAGELHDRLTQGQAGPIAADRIGICGHSMGGHGALTLGLAWPDRFRSISAFAPICNPSDCPWGEKALTAYLGPDRARWARHDAVRTLRDAPDRSAASEILVDQGTSDPFLAEQLHPDRLEAAARACNQRLTLRRHEGYDHGYFFIATFIADHLDHHARLLA